MDVSKIPPGRNPPDEINAVIEIPQGGVPLKYELDKVSGALFVNRFLHTAMYYPANYGFIPNTLSEDRDPCDCLVLSQVPVVPVAALNPFYDGIGELTDLPPIFRDQIEHFFRHYKDLERGKWVKLTGWADREKARTLIMEAISRFKPA